jgi:hypothetical protein
MIPMSFVELDEARETAVASSASGKREKKRKTATIARLNPEISVSTSSTDDNSSDDLRTGRWTNEELLYCDKLIEKFETGELPVADGVKLNDFLASMLKSKQSRLTKKMKNAKLSARAYKRTSGYVVDQNEAKLFSKLENAFFRSIPCSMEKAEIRFHVQKEWRELFSSYCLEVGQKLQADAWLNSIEEMDRRASRARDAAKMARRKRMMGYALEQDQMNPVFGVFIEPSRDGINLEAPEIRDLEDDAITLQKRLRISPGQALPKRKKIQPPPFLGRILTYMHRHSVPFEYVDAWVPSFVNKNDNGNSQKCRLCFAGCATAEIQVSPDGRSLIPLTKEDQCDLRAFGEYSQRFSFDVGCGLPGRVYHSGVPSWEQFVQNAPIGHFERSGGAVQWNIKTVLGIPVPSPNVGRIVVLFYSRLDRPQNKDMAIRMIEEMTKLLPCPKWKLVVDVGASFPHQNSETYAEESSALPQSAGTESSLGLGGTHGLLKMLTEYMPSDMSSPLSSYLHGFTSLRMLLLKTSKTQHDKDLIDTVVLSFDSYLSTCRPQSDIVKLVVRDFIALTQTSNCQLTTGVISGLAHMSSSSKCILPPVRQQSFNDLNSQQASHQRMHQSFQNPSPSHSNDVSRGVSYSQGVINAFEPTPVSELHGLNNHHQSQLEEVTGHYLQLDSNQGNGGNSYRQVPSNQGNETGGTQYQHLQPTSGNGGSIEKFPLFNAK